MKVVLLRQHCRYPTFAVIRKYTRDRRLRLKPALIQDTDDMVEDPLAPYLVPFVAYLMPQWPIEDSKGVSTHQNDQWNVAVNSSYLLLGKKAINFCKKQPRKTIWLPFSTIFVPFWVLYGYASVTNIGFNIQKVLLERGCQLTLSSIW